MKAPSPSPDRVGEFNFHNLMEAGFDIKLKIWLASLSVPTWNKEVYGVPHFFPTHKGAKDKTVSYLQNNRAEIYHIQKHL